MGKSFELEEALFDVYFRQGTDFSLKTNILDLCKTIRHDPNLAEKVLSSNDFNGRVTQTIQISKKIGVRAVPHFLIGRENVFSCYQSKKEFDTIISNALNEIEKNEDTTDGNSCSIDGIYD